MLHYPFPLLHYQKCCFFFFSSPPYYTITKKGLVEWLKVYALTSNPSTKKQNKTQKHAMTLLRWYMQKAGGMRIQGHFGLQSETLSQTTTSKYVL
jgi:hypothetical protein